MKSKIFYEKGLQFECTGCGKCCTGAPGYVYLSKHDIFNISAYLGMDKESFLSKYTRRVRVFGEKRISLSEKSNFDCIFYDSKTRKCLIYPVRPYQCRSYPFWKLHLRSQLSWDKLENTCPGINRGRVYSMEEIQDFIEHVPNYNIKFFDL